MILLNKIKIKKIKKIYKIYEMPTNRNEEGAALILMMYMTTQSI